MCQAYELNKDQWIVWNGVQCSSLSFRAYSNNLTIDRQYDRGLEPLYLFFSFCLSFSLSLFTVYLPFSFSVSLRCSLFIREFPSLSLSFSRLSVLSLFLAEHAGRVNAPSLTSEQPSNLSILPTYLPIYLLIVTYLSALECSDWQHPLNWWISSHLLFLSSFLSPSVFLFLSSCFLLIFLKMKKLEHSSHRDNFYFWKWHETP